jgi:hypothetical protein
MKLHRFIPHMPWRCANTFHIFHEDVQIHSTYSMRMHKCIPHIPWSFTDSFHIFHEAAQIHTKYSMKMHKFIPRILCSVKAHRVNSAYWAKAAKKAQRHFFFNSLS